jgi:hypothetical protein
MHFFSVQLSNYLAKTLEKCKLIKRPDIEKAHRGTKIKMLALINDRKALEANNCQPNKPFKTLNRLQS